MKGKLKTPTGARAMVLTESQIGYVNDVSVIMASVSLTGSLFIIACYAHYSHLRKFAFKLVCMLSVSDVLVI